jgi:hypothetical protein
MSEMTTQPEGSRPDLGGSRLTLSGSVQPPKAEDEGLSLREIKWIPLVVPLAALTMLLGAAAALSMAA